MKETFLISIREKVKIINASPDSTIVNSRFWNIVKYEILFYLTQKKIDAISPVEGEQLFGLRLEFMHLLLMQLNEEKKKSLN